MKLPSLLHRLLRPALLGLLSTAAVHSLQAQAIKVPNFSFEAQPAPNSFPFVNVFIDSWEKAAEPAYYDAIIGTPFGIPWYGTTGVFLDVNPYINHVGNQAGYLLGFPEVSLSQDYNSSATHDFDATFEVGKSYQLTVGVFGKNLAEGSTLELSLYYRNALNEKVIVSSNTVVYSAATFVNTPPLSLIDYAVKVPGVQPGDAWAGKKIGIQLLSTTPLQLATGGNWDLDNVRLAALADDAVVATSGTTTVYPLANDPVAPGGEWTLVSVSEPTVQIAGRALIIPAGYTGSFTYQAVDGTTKAQASVVVTAGTPITTGKKYTGLLRAADNSIKGWLNVSHSAKGALTAQVLVGTNKARVVTKLKYPGPSTATVTTALGSLDLDLAADGRLTTTLGALSSVLRPAVTTAPAGRHHVALTASRPDIAGGGIGVVTVKSTGVATVSLQMPDLKPALCGTVVSDNGTITFFALQTKKTSPPAIVAGEIVLANLPASDLTGEVAWLKPVQLPSPGQLLAGGADTTLNLNGSLYGGTIALDGPSTLTLDGGNLVATQTSSVTATAGVPALTGALKGFAARAKDGTFRVKVQVPGIAKPVQGNGLYLSKSHRAFGFFPGLNVGGKVDLQVKL